VALRVIELTYMRTLLPCRYCWLAKFIRACSKPDTGNAKRAYAWSYERRTATVLACCMWRITGRVRRKSGNSGGSEEEQQ
jgi:hypothetical protein